MDIDVDVQCFETHSSNASKNPIQSSVLPRVAFGGKAF